MLQRWLKHGLTECSLSRDSHNCLQSCGLWRWSCNVTELQQAASGKFHLASCLVHSTSGCSPRRTKSCCRKIVPTWTVDLHSKSIAIATWWFATTSPTLSGRSLSSYFRVTLAVQTLTRIFQRLARQSSHISMLIVNNDRFQLSNNENFAMRQQRT
jgi:hypothetical protein